MASSISICSNALLALGAHPINSFDEASEHARLCSNIYPTVRNDLLRKHPWNCAVKRVVLSPSSTAPAFGFGYQFPLPGDLIRILSVGREYEDIGYRVEGNRLLANQNVIYLRYLFRNEDESTWDSSLVNLAEAFMAAKLAYAVTGSASLRDSLTQEAAYLLRQAKSIDGQEEPPETLDGYPTYESRF
ncbi:MULTISPECIES: hypothetical protein [Klebsiella/Raoultella group]|jgi:hypothetical protein|uniref:hypothetical protein n=1 Tax=Klebsiella/Raoultella group TaxID=2890311 RepID=UPI000B957839|nr:MULTISPECIES: hypothetical protein [Klebsiella]MDM9659115.1 hypothetical protein [Raoultella planticola]EKT9722835.1 hypothetical protein [Klebsiella pneumoniae]EKV4192823.1 hypothetical protein [Klebsiella michiganensis]EKW6092691.1 hypothetical protein [Klebsiella pneumoniae]MBN4044217.1 hypothetical protein [Klebsiella michiganensis]